MLKQYEIDHLLAVGQKQREELLGIGLPAKSSGSEPEEAGAAPASPTNDDGGFSSGLDVSS